MSSRAFVIAVENYPESTSTSKDLPGTIQGAERFIEWLITSKEVSKGDIYFCCSGKSQYKTTGATHQEIQKEVIRLIGDGSGESPKVYGYVSGHGVQKVRPDLQPNSDLLLCSDFQDPETTGNLCMSLDELTTLLAIRLGSGSHYWFADICRTLVEEVMVGTLGIAPPKPPFKTRAAWFRLMSARPGEVARNDSLFLDELLPALDGSCDLVRDATGTWVSMENLARAISAKMQLVNRQPDLRSDGPPSAALIRSIVQPGPTSTIIDQRGFKSPPVELLTAFDEVLFLGETNSQLPKLLQEAFEVRGRRPWKRLQILAIEDLTTAHRPGVELKVLEEERNGAESFFRESASQMTDELRLFRYSFAGNYGSFWTSQTGTRRAHVSAPVFGMSIRESPANDFVDFPGARSDTVNRLFQFAEAVVSRPDCKLTFEYKRPAQES